MSKFSYIFFHVLIMILMMAMGVMGLLLLQYLFYGLGALVIIFGFLIFFSGTTINFVFDEFGNEWLVTNIQHRAIILCVTLVIGASIAILPTFFDIPQVIVSIVMILLGFGIGFRLHGENDSWKYDVSDPARLLGSLVPLSYMLNAGFFLFAALFELPLFIGILTTALCLVPHILRTVLVYRDSV